MGLSWEADQYDTVVTGGLLSGEISSMKIIEPGNSAASYMVWKINGQGPGGEAIVGARMPGRNSGASGCWLRRTSSTIVRTGSSSLSVSSTCC